MASKHKVDNLDAYIIAHHRSMTQAEISRATGASTSQVSRRVIALREAGRLESEQADSNGEAMPDERLAALDELCELLHRELSTAGGQSLARVSSEYRQAMAERENLRAEMGITQDNRYRVTLLDKLQMMSACNIDPDYFNAAFKAIMEHLRDRDALRIKDGVLKDE